MGAKAKSKLKVRHEEIDIRNIEEAPVNANQMSDADFKRLVASIDKEQYEGLRNLMTLAHKQGFKTPGQAMRKFLDIVTKHITEITKNKE